MSLVSAQSQDCLVETLLSQQAASQQAAGHFEAGKPVCGLKVFCGLARASG